MNLKMEHFDFSFSIENTKEEVDETIKALKELVPMLRRFVRK